MPCHSHRKEYLPLFQLVLNLPRRPFASANGFVTSKQELEILIPPQGEDRNWIFRMERGLSSNGHQRFRFFLESEVQIPMREALVLIA